MNRELLYSALDLAAILSALDPGCREQAAFLERVRSEEHRYLPEAYREDRRRLFLDVAYWMNYLADKPAIDAEFPLLQRDARADGRTLEPERFQADFSGLDLFFKSVRLRLLFGTPGDCVRLKRRTLLKRYGYRRLTPRLAAHIDLCLAYYRLRACVRGGAECRIEDVGMEDMIVFRLEKG